MASNDRNPHQVKIVGIDSVGQRFFRRLPRRSGAGYSDHGKHPPGERRVLHAGQLASLLDEIGKEQGVGLLVGTTIGRREVYVEPVVDGEAGVDALHVLQGAHQQACGNQKRERERHLDHRINLPLPGIPNIVAFHPGIQVLTAGGEGGRQAEENGADDSRESEEQRHPPIDSEPQALVQDKGNAG